MVAIYRQAAVYLIFQLKVNCAILIVGETMNSDIFINKSLTYAINEYLSSKNMVESERYNSFFVVVIRSLTEIYDELDILNPFYFADESLFYTNLEKYGYPKENIKSFLEELEKYYAKENDDGFVFIQKSLIDMFIEKYKTMNLSSADINRFRDLLYTPNAKSPLMVSYNFLMARDPDEIGRYFDDMISKNTKVEVEKPKETLNLEAYEILKYSLEDIKQMSAKELDDVNKEVYSYFDINDNAINKKYLLDKAVFDYNHPKSAFSTGNGYVDILLVLSLVATLAMVIAIITFVIL